MTIPPGTTLDRRGLAIAAVAALGAGAVHAALPTDEADAATVTDQAAHLLRRATFGPTPAGYAEAKKLGVSKWLDTQLKPSSIADTGMDSFAKRFPRLSWQPWQVREKIGYGWEVMTDYLTLHIARQIWSKRQLFESVCDFWNDHLVIPAPTGEVQATLHTWHRDVIRKHALGRYADLLKAAVRHPALLAVLDNASSTKAAPNENHGRELLELHTLGAGRFTETDVRNSALALTGLSFDHGSLAYEYRPQARYVGTLKVQGWSHSNSSYSGGEKVALSYLDYLARHPRTAERIAQKLCVRYVSDTPPADLVKSLAAVYVKNDTAMAPVLKALFTSKQFAASAGKKQRKPYESLVAALRVLGHGPDTSGFQSINELRWMAGRMGNAPGGWAAPNGYPDVAAAWTSPSVTLLRWNFLTSIAAQWNCKTMKLPAMASFVPKPLPATHGAFIDALAQRLMLPALTSTQREAICRFVDKKSSDPLRATDSAVTWRLGYMIALLLHSPNFALR